jgi:acyl-CoA dehydrogenase
LGQVQGTIEMNRAAKMTDSVSDTDGELIMFSDSIRGFLDTHASEQNLRRWREAGIVDRSAWQAAGEMGLLLPSIPAEYGGGGADFRFDAALIRELGLIGAEGWGMPLHSGIVAPYIFHYGTEEQRQRWLPKLAKADFIGAIAMSEPGAGSDLRAIKTRAVRSGNGWRIDGAKTFITNGQLANLIIVVARTAESNAPGGGLSLIVVETDQAPGFRRGRKLDKIGLDMGDTSELFFDDIFVPAANLLGEAGHGMRQLMQQLPQERLIIALECVAIMERALAVTTAYARDRKAFGKSVIDFQNTQFKLAEAKTEATIARVFTDRCIEMLIAGKLDSTTASMAKYWTSERACRIVDACLQLHGGYGYMNEYPIAEMYRDVRVKPIYGGTNEIMKLLIARSL